MKCPHCQKEFNAGKVMGSAKSPAKKAAAKKRGEFMRKAFANQTKLEATNFWAADAKPREPSATNDAGGMPDGGIPLKNSVRSAAPNSLDTRVMPKGGLSMKELAALVGSRMGRSTELPREETSLHNLPTAPFDFKDDNGDLHRVKAYGKTLKVCFLRDGVEEPIRNLGDGELETLWERRIIK